MGKKGLLFDDKRAKMLEYFFEQVVLVRGSRLTPFDCRKACFRLKNSKKTCPKSKESVRVVLAAALFAFVHISRLCLIVVSQSVKEVLQSLVDDDMVDQDKIGVCARSCVRLIL